MRGSLHAARGNTRTAHSHAWQLAAVVLAPLVVLGGLTASPAQIRGGAETLAAEKEDDLSVLEPLVEQLDWKVANPLPVRPAGPAVQETLFAIPLPALRSARPRRRRRRLSARHQGRRKR